MESNGALEHILRLYQRYYDVRQEQGGASGPFAAEAEFRSHNEQYFLVKAAKVADIDSNEFVFFATEDCLTPVRLDDLDSCAWQTGLSRVHPSAGHRNSDITLIILAHTIEEPVFALVKKKTHYKSYRFSLWGWSNYRVIAYELSSGRYASNRLGRDLRKIVCAKNISAGRPEKQGNF